jgi:hypothetical protein
MINRLTTVLVVALALVALSPAQQVLDQSQTIYNGGTSARNLPGYSEWQSFTAGITGRLTEVDLGFFAGINRNGGTSYTGTGTLRIFSGQGTGGTLLQTEAVNVSATSSATYAPCDFNQFKTNVASVAGNMYTFDFTPTQGGGLPDPYGICVGTIFGAGNSMSSPYTRGMDGDSNLFSMDFKTYVTAAVPEPTSLISLVVLASAILVKRFARN